MDSMDIKGIAWVGNIYQKFEAMCLEVEEAMCQETAKYVENQVQTVGASMKRFCSDVMQDLLPPSSKDLSKVASADLLLNPYLEFGIHKKPISNIKEDTIHINPVCNKGISENNSNSNNNVWEDWSAASFNWEISDNDDTNCDMIAMQASNGTSGTNLFTKSSAKVGKRSRCISSSNIIRAEHADTCENSGLVTQIGLQATSNISNCQLIDGDVSHTDSCENNRPESLFQSGSHVIADTQCGESVGDQFFRSNTESSADCSPDLEDETENDTTLQMIEPIGHESESEFEEACVLVDGNDCLSDNHKEEIRRSYRKKIQNAFSLKKKLARKQEYKQLAAQYNNVNELIRSENVKAKKSTHDSLEPEWELL